MKTAKDYNRAQGFSLLLLGEPFAGKTCLASLFKQPLFFDADGKLNNIFAVHPDTAFNYVDLNADESGKTLPMEQRWQHTVAQMIKYANDPNVSTMVFDSLTTLSDYLTSHILAKGSPSKPLIVGGEQVMTMQMWSPYLTLMKRFIMACRTTGKAIIFTAHLKIDTDELTGTMGYRPNIGGQLKDTLAGMFSDVWLCCTKTTSKGVTYVVRTAPTPRITLGTSLKLPPEFEFNWDIIKDQLAL